MCANYSVVSGGGRGEEGTQNNEWRACKGVVCLHAVIFRVGVPGSLIRPVGKHRELLEWEGVGGLIKNFIAIFSSSFAAFETV